MRGVQAWGLTCSSCVHNSSVKKSRTPGSIALPKCYLSSPFTSSPHPIKPSVGAQDRIFRGESTFAVEMLETSSLLRHATPASLVVRASAGFRGTH